MCSVLVKSDPYRRFRGWNARREGRFPGTREAEAGLGNPQWDLGRKDGMCLGLEMGLLIPGRSNSLALTGNDRPLFFGTWGSGELKDRPTS